jgi:hypothetical protein
MYNLMTLAVEKGTAEFSDFTSQLGDFALEAELAGVSLEELLAIYAAATRVTTPAMAATWVSNIFRRFTDPKFFEGLKSYGIQIKKFEEGTGRWVSVERTLTETQQDRIHSINISMEKQRNTLMRYVGTAESTWDTYMEGLKIFRETGFKRGGIDDRALNTYINFMENQRKLNEIIAEGTGTYREWRGELRPGVDMLVELAEAISNVEDEERQRQIVHDLFPSARAQRGFLAYLKGLKDINEWQEEWREDTNNLREDFEDVADTVNSRATLLWQKIQALGDIFYKTYEEDIKVFIGGLSEIADLFFKLDPRLAKQIALWGLLLLSLAPLSLIIGTMAIGIGTMVTAIGMLVSPGVAIFGDKLKLAFDALKDYGISDMQDVVRFFMDLAVQLGIISESDAAGIMEAFGISLRPMGDPAVLKFIDAFRGMIDRIAVLKDDLVECFDAFRLLLEDIANRECVIGTIVGYIERIAAAVLPFLGKEAAPIAGEVRKVLPEGETGPEGKKEWLEFAGATYIGTKIVTAILGALGLGGGAATVGVVAAIGAAVYTAMHPKEVEQFFTFTLPQEFEINVMAPARYFWETWLPTWWETALIPSWNKFWEEGFPLWWTTNVKEPVVNYFSEGGPFSAWWTANIKDPVTTFFTTGLPQWFTDNIKNPVVTFIESLPERIRTFLTVTAPQKIGFWMGYIAGKAAEALVDWPPKIIAWIQETGWPILKDALSKGFAQWAEDFREQDLPKLFKGIITGVVAAAVTAWTNMTTAFENFLVGFGEGFWTALFGKGGKPEEYTPPFRQPNTRDECLAAGGTWVTEQGVGRCVMQRGGIVQRDMPAFLHRGEVVFNPQRPRQDLARVVNAAMARAGGGGYEAAPIYLTPTVNVGTFAGSQAEFTQLQNMLENMSFDMAMRVERKLAEARRVENRRRE